MKGQEVSRKIKELRNRKGLSQEELSEKSGLSLRTIQRIENGETEPRGDSLKRLANVLNVTPDEVFDWKIIEDHGVLRLLTLSQFGFLAFPLLGILIPLTIWILKKDQVKNVDKHGKDILNFQITWVITLFLVFFSAFIFNGLSIFLVFVLYIYNVFIIIINIKRIEQDRVQYYRPAYKLL